MKIVDVTKVQEANTCSFRPATKYGACVGSCCAFAGSMLLIAVMLSVAAVSANEKREPLFNLLNVQRTAPFNWQTVAFNGRLLVAVGEAGVVAKSYDAGDSWEQAVVDIDSSLIDVTACPDRSFLALDFYGRVWRADSTADQWEAVDLPKREFSPLASTCAPSGDYWVVGTNATVLRSENQGRNWERISLLDVEDNADFEDFAGDDSGMVLGEDINFTVIRFMDDQNAVLAGEFGFLALSADSGETWEIRPQPGEEFYSYDAWFQTPQEGWLVGRAGQILYTDDGGASWKQEDNPLGGVPMYRLHGNHESGLVFAVGELGLSLVRREESWRIAGDKQPGGYMRGAVYLPEQGALIVVGGGGAQTPATIRIEREQAETRGASAVRADGGSDG